MNNRVGNVMQKERTTWEEMEDQGISTFVLSLNDHIKVEMSLEEEVDEKGCYIRDAADLTLFLWLNEILVTLNTKLT